MMKRLLPAAWLLGAALAASATSAPALAAPKTAASTKTASFQTFFTQFRQAVLANDRNRVADMTVLPFKDFSGGEVDRSAATKAQFLAHYDRIFTPAVIAGIRAGKVRAFKPGSDDGEAPGPISKGEYLLDIPEYADQLIFAPTQSGYRLNRIPFYS
ncbi:hypothetical protein [Novosphingobium sp.]|jgi:hypothetical protein|uniref:hypothetical protein n=1 Tax=Novosphingobium sp. TaxID=1874826 RepID=UPI002FE3BE9C